MSSRQPKEVVLVPAVQWLAGRTGVAIMAVDENTPDVPDSMNRALFDRITATMTFDNPQLALAARAVLCDQMSGVEASKQFSTEAHTVLPQSLSRKVTEIRNVYLEFLQMHELVDVNIAVPGEVSKLLTELQNYVIKSLEDKSSE